MIQFILLQIFHKLNKQRTVSAAFHLLKGKRSGQTIQDVGIFRLHPYFALLPKLSRPVFDEEVKKMFPHLVVIHEDGTFTLTEEGVQRAKDNPMLQFNGWHYRGNEHLFFSRLMLVVQSLSHYKNGQISFSPIIKDETTQRWVRSYLLWGNYQSGNMNALFFDEVLKSLKQAALSEQQHTILMYRLTGYKVTGWTWQQLANTYKTELLDIQLHYIEALHKWLHTIETNAHYTLLQKMAEHIKITAVLTSSANETAILFRQGYSIQQISQIRRLKQNTIEDHLVEWALNDSSFSIEQFVTLEDQALVSQIVDAYDTKKLKVLYEIIGHLSYFQLRLILAKGAPYDA